MAPARATPPPPPLSKGSYNPLNDSATHRDLLLFEERLKTNAASLNRRKRKYQLFLVQLLLIITFLLSQVFLDMNLLDMPYRLVLRTILPQQNTVAIEELHVHPYVASGLLFVAVTTLVLFFASGMYSEKIAYANRYVPHANRALRNFNMYLNLRQPPLKSFNPFAKSAPPTTPPPRPPSPTRVNKRSASSVPIPTIPPSSNPRGELIFSSKVDRGFRDAYERYRAAFERKREEREREAFFTKSLLGRALAWLPFVSPPSPSTTVHGANSGSTDLGRGPGHGPTRSISGSSSGSLRGRPGGTPNGSRRSSPVPSTRGGRAGSSRNTTNSRSGTPTIASQETMSNS